LKEKKKKIGEGVSVFSHDPSNVLSKNGEKTREETPYEEKD